jgi:hypothetical protein
MEKFRVYYRLNGKAESAVVYANNFSEAEEAAEIRLTDLGEITIYIIQIIGKDCPFTVK